MKTHFSIFFFFFTAFSFAQSDFDDLKKYWHYRDRLLGNDGMGGFIDLGLGQGQSIPATGRNIDCDCIADWHLINSRTPRHEGNGIMKWGDATVHLGYYLAMLAMEYRNLKDVRASTRLVEKELYFALKAYERLDSLAEVTLGLEAELNGFFLRDDVPVDFYKGPARSEQWRFQHPVQGGYQCIGSDYSKGTRSVDGGSYISQDQVTSLLLGFAFVKKFAGEAVYIYDRKQSFGELAELYTHLIVAYMSKNKWKIRSPDGQRISNRWGGDARAFSVLFAAAADRITEKQFGFNYGKRLFIGRLLKGSYGWAFGLHNERNYSMIFRLMTISNQWSTDKMAKRAEKSDKIFYALADAVLNDRKLGKAIEKTDFEALVKNAPWDGPCVNIKGCNAPNGWKASHLWFHTKHKNGNPYQLSYEYAGIDFMLLYNLYHYYYRDSLPLYKAPVPNSKNSKPKRPNIQPRVAPGSSKQR